MYDNDKYGDCTCAATGHMVQNWTASSGKEATPADASILKMYEYFVGTPSPTAGCRLLDVLRYWRTTGLGKHKIQAFAQLELHNEVQLRDAIFMFGGAYIGVELPDFAVQADDPLTVPWVVPPQGPVGDAAPDPQEGHCIPAVAYDARNVYVVTWGAVKAMSWQFYKAYSDEAYAVLSHDWIAKNGKAVAGFDLKTLEADLQLIHQVPSKLAGFTSRHRPVTLRTGP
jgi:hypothetical protein